MKWKKCAVSRNGRADLDETFSFPLITFFFFIIHLFAFSLCLRVYVYARRFRTQKVAFNYTRNRLQLFIRQNSSELGLKFANRRTLGRDRRGFQGFREPFCAFGRWLRLEARLQVPNGTFFPFLKIRFRTVYGDLSESLFGSCRNVPLAWATKLIRAH